MSNWLADCTIEDMTLGPGGMDGWHVESPPTAPGMRAGRRGHPQPFDLRTSLPGALTDAERATIRQGMVGNRIKTPEREHRDNTVIELRRLGLKHREIADLMTESGDPITVHAVGLLLRREGLAKPHGPRLADCTHEGCPNRARSDLAQYGLCAKHYVPQYSPRGNAVSRTIEYRAWKNAQNQGRYPWNPVFDDFLVFLAEVGPKPKDNLVLRVLDPAIGYSPGNITWGKKVRTKNA